MINDEEINAWYDANEKALSVHWKTAAWNTEWDAAWELLSLFIINKKR